MKKTWRWALGIAAIATTAIAVTVDVPSASAANAPPPAAPIPVAHSALLNINASVVPEGLVLHVLHASNQVPIDGRDVTVTVDGKNEPLTAEPEVGNFLLPTKDLGEGERQLDITVAHDGIREILTGKVALPKASGGLTGSWDSSRKQMAWWVLNIAVVLIAVLAISKRSSKPAEKDADEE
jgi:hypothetical protein